MREHSIKKVERSFHKGYVKSTGIDIDSSHCKDSPPGRSADPSGKEACHSWHCVSFQKNLVLHDFFHSHILPHLIPSPNKQKCTIISSSIIGNKVISSTDGKFLWLDPEFALLQAEHNLKARDCMAHPYLIELLPPSLLV